MSLARKAAALASVMLAACSAAAPSPAAPGPPPPLPCPAAPTKPTKATDDFPTREARVALYRHLLAEIDRIHVPTPHLDESIGLDLPLERATLESVFADATDKPGLANALRQLAASLHNAHCHFAEGSWLGRPVTAFDSGISFAADVASTPPRFFVTRVAKEIAGRLSEGDVVESVDGVSLLAHPTVELAWLSSWNNSDGVAAQIARWLPRRGAKRALPQSAGAVATWRFRPKAGGPPFELALPWKPADHHDSEDDNDHSVDYTSQRCGDLPARVYGPYTLTAVGEGFCLYTSKKAPFRAYPIVRQFTFLYRGQVPAAHLVRADHEHLSSQLRALGHLGGLIVDLRDNGGGLNPNFFLDWYGSTPYRDHVVRMRLMPELAAPEAMARVSEISGLEGMEAQYPKWLADKKSDGFGPFRPFFCSDKGCDWDNAYVPRHRVTDASVALLVGPYCVSSCDQVAEVFDTYDMGPLVGLSPALAFTTVRYPLEVKLDGGPTLGVLTLAISEEKNGKGGDVEGVPRRLAAKVADTPETHAAYDATLVKEAMAALVQRERRAR